ncbi:MAG: sensor histidine kinase, partial [Desulfosarcina sp.]|nr:sensor histidine kinase [Desulfobacterales bacterium]
MEKINDKAAFSGKVTASVTHEIQNVLAIIQENAGLMEDILHMNQENLASSGERLQKCIESIKKQTYRGVGLTSALNQFAHTADHALTQINLYDTVKKLLFLVQRF